MIKTILFDNNGVLSDKDEDGTLETMSRSFKFDYEKVRPEYIKLRDKIDTGEVTTEEFYELMAGLFDDVDDKKQIADYHIALYDKRPNVIDFAKSLRQDFNVALLTNFCDRFDEFNQKRWQLDEFIATDNIFVSSKLKMRKPDREIYEHVLEKLKNKPGEVVFVDDSKKNVEAAKLVGMHGIVYNNLEQFRDELNEIIKKENHDTK